MLKKKVLISLLLSCALLSACGKEAAAPPMMVPQVTVVTLKAEPVTLTRELPGRTSAFKVAEVRPQVSGIVKAQLFREGGMVEAGQALYQLDDATYKADYDSARANLQGALAALNEARLTAERTAELVKSGAVSKQDNDSAQAALQRAEADVAAARAAVQRSKVQLDYARISAPIGGRIGKSSITQGALVTANQTSALATVQQLDPIYVDVTQSTAELLALRKALEAGTVESTELPVTILLEDGSQYEHKGKLEFAEVSVEPSTGSVLLRIIVPNPDNILLPGMYVRALLGSGVRQQAILVPQQAVARDPKGNTSVMVVSGEGVVAQRSVVVSRTIGDKWLVEEGLQAGDKVVVEGLQKIRPGVPVQAVEREAPQTPAAGDAVAGDANTESQVQAPTAQES
ncbi:efflux RND transporter periplasmic adaptor subunit [Microbulbifer thermotolerans]|uniref:efflux RND transporter periplasmic adaptor subunit n=1 Tax=Microbulbifer thermotolerans TaxID=252514 RepID=UPI002248800C|nr:efflux RND transporter periplasmic adaptor subunit [Microbulbifer thermotolerans]MCX2831130.1 efflux RND transporter periplasmic adaptor subunit [Microbulbifer thermotolerans]